MKIVASSFVHASLLEIMEEREVGHGEEIDEFVCFLLNKHHFRDILVILVVE